jgi:hypothetical protein
LVAPQNAIAAEICNAAFALGRDGLPAPSAPLSAQLGRSAEHPLGAPIRFMPLHREGHSMNRSAALHPCQYVFIAPNAFCVDKEAP